MAQGATVRLLIVILHPTDAGAIASIESPMSGQAESSTAATILRNDDPLTLALRNGDALNIDDIARLDRSMSPAYDVLSSLGTSNIAVFSTHDNSTVTKPTSTGSTYYNNAYKGKGKAKASYASSLSVANGSGSEAEAQRNTVGREALFAMGDWTSGDPVPTEPLRGTARAKTRCRSDRNIKHKKPTVKIFHHVVPAADTFERDSLARGKDQVVLGAYMRDSPGELPILPSLAIDLLTGQQRIAISAAAPLRRTKKKGRSVLHLCTTRPADPCHTLGYISSLHSRR